jgi:thioredoxin reductase (NADPH)
MQDVIIIGAGPAGLADATHLGRFRRSPLVIDGGDSRARWISTGHNIPGFFGVNGAALLGKMRSQAEQYGADIRRGFVHSLTRQASSFAVDLGGEILFSRFVVLATGAKDHLPPLPGVSVAFLRKVLKVCPICDGFEAAGKRIAVLGRDAQGEREALFLRDTYSDDVTYVQLGKSNDPTGRARLAAAGIAYMSARLGDLTIEDGAVQLTTSGGRTETFDVIYCALGASRQDAMAAHLGAARDASNGLIVNRHQQTTIEGLYAAGDMVQGQNQIVVAAAEAAAASADIHYRLRRR